MAGMRNNVTQKQGTVDSAEGPFTYREAAKKLRRSVSWLEKEVAARRVPFRRLGARGVVFTNEDIAQILEQSYCPPVAQDEGAA